MADAFTKQDALSLLAGKHIMFIGDSNTRAQYKDLLWLLTFNTLINDKVLRKKLEPSFIGDDLIKKRRFDSGRDYMEVRQMNFHQTNTVIEFMFISRCYNEELEELFEDIKMKNSSVPDAIIISSCMWDISRWGPNGVPEYKTNMIKLMRLMKQSLPAECLVIWTTALPPGPFVRGGLLIKQVACMEPIMRFEIMEANLFARDVVANHGFDVLDFHYHLRMQMHRRSKDGIHYTSVPCRFLTNLLLTHMALSWDHELPNNIKSISLDRAIAQAAEEKVDTTVNMPSTRIFSKIKSPVAPKPRRIEITFAPDKDEAHRRIIVPAEPLSENQRSVESTCFTRTVNNLNQPQQGPRRNKRKKNRNNPYGRQPSSFDSDQPNYSDYGWTSFDHRLNCNQPRYSYYGTHVNYSQPCRYSGTTNSCTCSLCVFLPKQ